ncbi:MAG: glycoside hydrolase family 76 protein, partial [Catenulispora sp.]
GWYRQFLPGHGRSLATMWGIVHLFGATNAIALADPTPAHRAAARRFADGAERYWNPELRPVPAYGPSPLGLGPHRRTWYDDEAWWGVAFWDAYRATHDRRYLRSAARSLRFIDSGWDPRRGGIYWDTRHTFKASESLAGGTLTAAGLYETTHDPHYLALARKYIRWADRTIKARDGLYGGRSTPAVPMAYVEGPMAEALVRLCHATGRKADCAEGERLMRTTANHFRVLTQGPQMDAIYIRSVVQLYRLDHNPRWYRIATTAANEAIARAADAHGRYLKMWDGRPIRVIGTPPDKLQIHAATTSVLAWVAAAHPRRRPHG